MNYCPKCGARLDDDHRFCPNCGHELYGNAEVVNQSSSYSSDHETLQQVAKIFMIIMTVLAGFALFPLIWMVPMTVHYSHCIRDGRKAGVAFAVCTLLFCSTISGILILVDENA